MSLGTSHIENLTAFGLFVTCWPILTNFISGEVSWQLTDTAQSHNSIIQDNLTTKGSSMANETHIHTSQREKFSVLRLFFLIPGPSICSICTQQLDFLGNCQCRLNFLDNIINKEARAQVILTHNLICTTQMEYLSVVGTILGHCYPIQWLFKIKRGILGYRIVFSTFFDNNFNYLLGNIHSYSITAYVNRRTCET